MYVCKKCKYNMYVKMYRMYVCRNSCVLKKISFNLSFRIHWLSMQRGHIRCSKGNVSLIRFYFEAHSSIPVTYFFFLCSPGIRRYLTDYKLLDTQVYTVRSFLIIYIMCLTVCIQYLKIDMGSSKTARMHHFNK